ncbi:MAG TPA: hypothetical protein VM490_15205 [Armatimonadaceae bacterium]|nr:hypothetical protein [Armatimonadaceae bacterium]
MNMHTPGAEPDIVRLFAGFSLEFCLVLIVPFLFIVALYCVCWALQNGWHALRAASPDARRFALCLAGAAASGAVCVAECSLGREMPLPRAALLIGAALFLVATASRRDVAGPSAAHPPAP